MVAMAVSQIVEYEAPVCFEQIVARLKDAYGIERASPRFKDKIRYVLERNKTPYTIQNCTLSKDPANDVIFYWKNSEDATRICNTFRTQSDIVRSGLEISVNEAARACSYVCKTQFGMPREDLISEAGKAIGFKVTSGHAKLLLNAAVDFAISRGELVEYGFKVRYKGQV